MEFENYFFEDEPKASNRKLVLVIYDIHDNRIRNRLSKHLLGYGFRIQKSCFEATITPDKLAKLKKELPCFANDTDSIRVYEIEGRAKVTSFGNDESVDQEDIIII